MELVDSKAMPAAANRFLQGDFDRLNLLALQACSMLPKYTSFQTSEGWYAFIKV